MVQTILLLIPWLVITLIVSIPPICLILYRRRRRRACLVLSYLWCMVTFWLLGVFTKHTLGRYEDRLVYASDASQLLHAATAIREGRVKEGLAFLDSCLAETIYRTAYDIPDGKMGSMNIDVLEAWRGVKEYYETYDANESSDSTGIPQVRRRLAYVPWSDMQLAIKKFEQTYRKGERVAAPAINMKSWITEPMSSDRFKDRVILLDFWNTRCGPCIKSLPELQKMYDAYRDRGLVVLACAGGDEKETRQYLNKHGYHFPAGMVSRQMYLDYAVRWNPSYFLIDRDGCLAWGPEARLPTDDELTKLLTEHLESERDK